MRRVLRRAFLGITFIQTILAVTVYLRGFPFFGTHLVSNAPLWEAPVALFHLPGILALSLVGLCCGFRNSLVLGPKIAAGHIAMTPSGSLILTATNWSVWALLVVLLAIIGYRRARRERTPDPDAVTAAATTDP